MGSQLASGKTLDGSEAVNTDVITTRLHEAETIGRTEVYTPDSAQSEGDSIVNSIKGSQNYATNVHRVDLKKTNQFAMLDKFAGDDVTEREVGDLALMEMETQRPLKTSGSSRKPLENSLPGSKSGYESGQGQYSKNKSQSSSGKRSHSPNVINVN